MRNIQDRKETGMVEEKQANDVLVAEERFLTGENFYSQHLLGAHKKTDGSFVFRVWSILKEISV